jgi:hypothetical protein
MIIALHHVISGYGFWAANDPRGSGSIEIRQDKGAFADGAREELRTEGGCAPDHRVWSLRPYTVFLNEPAEVHGRIDYILKNPEKEGLDRQHWNFVQEYNGWPLHKHKQRR